MSQIALRVQRPQGMTFAQVLDVMEATRFEVVGEEAPCGADPAKKSSRTAGPQSV